MKRQIADFVEEQGAVVGGLEPADAIALSAGEGAFDVAEQLGFEQGLGGRAEVDRDHRVGASPRQSVDFARDDLLAGAVFAEDQDIGIGRRGAVDERPHALHRRRLAKQRGFGRGANSEARPRSVRASIRLRRSAAALRTVAASRSLLHGLATKSLAPALSASTATETAPWAVMITTAASGSSAMIRPRKLSPSRPSVAPRSKLRSSRIASGLSFFRSASSSAGDLRVSTRSNRSRSASRAASAISGSSSTTTARLNGRPRYFCSATVRKRTVPYSNKSARRLARHLQRLG